MIGHAFLTLLFLLNGQWIAFLINSPLTAYNVNKIMNKRHMYDATEIFRTLGQHKKESFIKLGFYLLTFFYYLYRYVSRCGQRYDVLTLDQNDLGTDRYGRTESNVLIRTGRTWPFRLVMGASADRISLQDYYTVKKQRSVRLSLAFHLRFLSPLSECKWTEPQREAFQCTINPRTQNNSSLVLVG